MLWAYTCILVPNKFFPSEFSNYWWCLPESVNKMVVEKWWFLKFCFFSCIFQLAFACKQELSLCIPLFLSVYFYCKYRLMESFNFLNKANLRKWYSFNFLICENTNIFPKVKMIQKDLLRKTSVVPLPIPSFPFSLSRIYYH